MRSGKKSIAVLSALLALVLAVQAFAFTAVKLGTSDAADSVEAGVTRQVMDAKPCARKMTMLSWQPEQTPLRFS